MGSLLRTAHGPNPFDTDLARVNSNYTAPEGGRLVRSRDGSAALWPLTEVAHDAFRALVLDRRFSCVGAKAALRSGAYRFGAYGEMGSAAATAGLARDLFTFVAEQPEMRSEFTTFVASFTAPHSPGETEFEALLWTQLQALHDADAVHHSWDPRVSDDPEDPGFSFSFAGRAFFVVGLHAASSRWTRRFAWPTLVFNAHEQFELLRENGRYDRFREVIRAREQALQGSVNPVLRDFGASSEARQYSGRDTGPEWKCPFHPHPERKKP